MITEFIPFHRLGFSIAGFFTPGIPLFRCDRHYRLIISLLFDYAAQLGISVLAWSIEQNRLYCTLQVPPGTPDTALLRRSAAQFFIDRDQTEILPSVHFFARPLHEEAGLLRACHYVHCAPAADRICLRPEEWCYSNLLEFCRSDFWLQQQPLLQRIFNNGRGYRRALALHISSPEYYPVNIRLERLNFQEIPRTSVQHYPLHRDRHSFASVADRRKEPADNCMIKHP